MVCKVIWALQEKKTKPMYFIVQLSIILSIPESLYTEDVGCILETET